jgi:P2-related tail formation protein
MMTEDERKRARSASVARWRARNPERAREQTKKALEKFNKKEKLKAARRAVRFEAMKLEIRRLKARVKKLEARG